MKMTKHLKIVLSHLLILDSSETVHHPLVLVSSCNSLVCILKEMHIEKYKMLKMLRHLKTSKQG